MRTQSSTRLADRLISALAGRQHGVVARWQLLEAGVSGRQIKLRLAAGRLIQLYRGVYLVGAVAPPHAHEMAALLALNLKAALSHRSAAALWELLPYPATAPVWVTIPSERRATPPRIKIHRAQLEAATSAGATASPSPAHHARSSTWRQRSTTTSSSESSPRRATGRSRAKPSFATSSGETPTSAASRRYATSSTCPAARAAPAHRRNAPCCASCARNGIQGYDTNAEVAGYEVDFLWRDLSFAVEVDGYDAHSGRVAFERDRLKIAVLKANGVSVMPVTGRQIRDDADGVLARLLAALASARRSR